MTETDIYAPLREALLTTGSCHFTGPDGKRVFIVMAPLLGLEGPGALIAYEGTGATFWDMSRPLNQFQLMQGGFSIRVSPTLSEMVNRVFAEMAPKLIPAEKD